MTITYNIQNVTPGLARTVMLRKFFQMVFMGNDRRSLRIYTATVIGASSQKTDTVPNEEKTYHSNLGEIPEFRMKFSFLIGNSDNNEIESVFHEDLTESEHGFLNEISCIRKVWGEACDIIVDDQAGLRSKLAQIQGKNVDSSEELTKSSAELSKYKLLWTEHEKSKKNRESLFSLSVHGAYQDTPDEIDPHSRDDIALKSSYTIGVPKDVPFPKSMELVNWVRTTIQFKYEIDDNNLNYTLKRSLLPEDETTYLAPDFTWYFSPVVKSYIDNHNSIVEVKRRMTSAESECTCPIQHRKVYSANDKFQNSIDTVPNKMTVDFHHWTQERIRLRQKYRLAAKEILPSEYTFNSLSEINIFLDTADEHSRGNRQFITNILLSFALAFGIDSTRLEDVGSYFGNFFPADVLWLALLVIFSLTLINTPVTQSDPGQINGIRGFFEKHTRGIRKFALLFSLTWFALVFVVLRVEIIKGLFEGYAGWIGRIMRCCYWVVIFVNLLYLHLWKKQTDGRLWANLLGRDIL